MKANIENVRAFWDSCPCQSHLSQAEDRRRFFEEISLRRYGRREWHVPKIAHFEAFAGKDVLEIGCGIGTDGIEFARHGARYVGFDLSPESITLAKERFDLFNIKGTFKIGNAEEKLPFADESFDHIYSFGVLHHSPNTQAIVDEMHRVLRPGGTFTVMLYNRSSINYYVEIMFLRKLLRWLLWPQFAPRVIAKATGYDERKLSGHRKVLMSRRDLSREEWVSINTDGPDCPLAKVYGKREASELFRRFREVTQEIWEFNTDHWPFVGKLIPERVVHAMGSLWGWHRIIYGAK